MSLHNLPVHITFEEDVFIARCPEIQWAFAEWSTPQEALRELISVIELIEEYRLSHSQDISVADFSVSWITTTSIFTSIPVIHA